MTARRRVATPQWREAEDALSEARGKAQREFDLVNAAYVRAGHDLLAAETAWMADPGGNPAAYAAYQEAERRYASASARLDDAVRLHVSFLDGPRQKMILNVIQKKADAFDAERETRGNSARKVNEAMRTRIEELTRQREPAKCIAVAVGLSTRTIETVINQLREAGRLPPARRRRTAKR